MTELSVARTIARSEQAVIANNGKTELEIARILALGPDAAALVKGTGTPPVVLPGAPRAPSASVPVAGTAAVAWSTPEGGSGGPGSPFINAVITSTPPTTTTTVAFGNFTTNIVFAYTPGASYVFHVAATNADGTGPAADTNSVVPIP